MKISTSACRWKAKRNSSLPFSTIHSSHRSTPVFSFCPSTRYNECTMRNELMAWFAREGLLLSSALSGADDPQDEVKVILKPPLVALSRASADFRQCPDPVLFGYPEDSLELME